jgi:hypothetical protein
MLGSQSSEMLHLVAFAGFAIAPRISRERGQAEAATPRALAVSSVTTPINVA